MEGVLHWTFGIDFVVPSRLVATGWEEYMLQPSLFGIFWQLLVLQLQLLPLTKHCANSQQRLFSQATEMLTLFFLSPQRLIFGYDKTYIISRLNFNLQCRSA
jgi:uncharacterized membrane protein YagU involved in acid resistance